MASLKQKTLVRQIALGLSAWGTLAALPALAQTAPAPAEVGQLGTVTVTANRRVEDQQKVSTSVTGITGDGLAARNITDLSQMEGVAPGFTFGRSGSDARPAIRGVRTENVAVNADTTIGFFVDGIYKSRAQQALASFVDVERVEIQRGPQGTLFGRNTFGGNIAITTVAPQLRTTEGLASLLVGSYGKLRFEGAVNAPLGDTVAVRLAGTIDRADPYVKNDFNGSAGLFDQDLKYLRGSVKFQPNKDFDVVIRADITEQGGKGGSAFGYKQAGTYFHSASCQQLFGATLTVINARPGNRDGVADCTRTQGAGAGTGGNAVGTTVDQGIPLYQAGNAYRVDNDYATFLRLKDHSVSVDASYRLASFTLKSITGYTDFRAERSADSDMSASTVAIDYQDTAAKTFSQEFQILSEGSGPIGYVAGVYFFKDELRGVLKNQQLPRTIRSSALNAPLVLPQNGAGFFDQQEPTTHSKAIYGQLSFRTTEAMTLTAGARYTRDTKSFRFANANAVLPINPATGLPDGNQISFDTPSPPDSAYGTAGTTNCTPPALAVPGYNCGGPTNNVLFGATYADATFSKATGRLAADYKLSPSQLVYASLSNGFRSGGFNSGQAIEALRTFKPETVNAIEVGSKNRFLGNTLQVNIAAYSNQYRDLQEQRQVPVGATTVSTIFNAAKAKANGLEVETEWRTTSALTLGGTLSLLDAKYTSFPDVALPFGTSILVADPSSIVPQVDANGVVIAPAGQRRIFAPGYNCGVVPGTGGAGQPAAAYGCDLSGKRIPYAANWSGSAFFKYDIAVGSGTVTPMLIATFNSGYFGQPTNAEIEKQGRYVKADFKLNWRISDKLAVQAFVDNLTDKQVINRFVWGGGGALQISAAPPRTFGLKLAYSSF